MIFEVHDYSKTNAKAHDTIHQKLRLSLDSFGNNIWSIRNY